MRQAITTFFAAFCFAAALAGCGGPSDMAAERQAESDRCRIVSLSPAISRTLKDFGIEDRIVGRTPWCESIDESIPVVGDLYNLDYEALVKLRPTHVLVQPPATGVDRTLKALAEEKGWRVGQWRLDSIEDVEAMVRDVPAVLAGTDAQMLDDLSSRAAELLNRLAAARSPHGEAVFQGRTLLVIGFDPVMAFGPGSYVHDLLVSMGGRNAVTAGAYTTLNLEDVVRLAPGAIIIVKPLAGEEVDPFDLLGPLADVEVEAVTADRVAILDHPDAAMPSTGLIGVADELREILVSFSAGAP